jgi:hypothetical protein
MQMNEPSASSKPIVFSAHALRRMREGGAREEDVREAIQSVSESPLSEGCSSTA